MMEKDTAILTDAKALNARVRALEVSVAELSREHQDFLLAMGKLKAEIVRLSLKIGLV